MISFSRVPVFETGEKKKIRGEEKEKEDVFRQGERVGESGLVRDGKESVCIWFDPRPPMGERGAGINAMSLFCIHVLPVSERIDG